MGNIRPLLRAAGCLLLCSCKAWLNGLLVLDNGRRLFCWRRAAWGSGWLGLRIGCGRCGGRLLRLDGRSRGNLLRGRRGLALRGSLLCGGRGLALRSGRCLSKGTCCVHAQSQ